MSEERTSAKWKIVAGIVAIVLFIGSAIAIIVGVSRATCKHVWNAGEITAEATCYTPGEITYTCEECNKKKKEEIQTLQHVTDYYLPPIAATCEEDGREAGNICPLCDTILVGGQKIPALGHHIVEDPAEAPTCLGTGKTKGSHCDRDGCDYIGIPQAIVPATGHSIVTVPGTAATCTTNGWTDEQSCEWCDEVFTASEILPAIGHKDANADGRCDVCEIDVCAEDMHVAEEIPAVAATCTTDGWTKGTRCANCGEVLTTPEKIPALGHDDLIMLEPQTATCAEMGLSEGQYCGSCDTVLIEQVEIPALGHIVTENLDWCDRCHEMIVDGIYVAELVSIEDLVRRGSEQYTDFEAGWYYFDRAGGSMDIDFGNHIKKYYYHQNYEPDQSGLTEYYNIDDLREAGTVESTYDYDGTYIRFTEEFIQSLGEGRITDGVNVYKVVI